MKYKILVFTLICWASVNAQVTNQGVPKSWEISLRKTLTPLHMKGFDLKKLQIEDAQNDYDKSRPWRFGYELKVNLGLQNAGVWEQLSNGDRLWRINIVSKGAKTMNFIFDTYKIPKGASLYIYNDDRSDLLGAYTEIFNRDDEMLGTWLIQGDNVWLEYHEPASVIGKGKLNIAKVIHGYRSITQTEIEQKGLNDSGSCNYDVDCSVGSDFDSLKERLKHSVAFIIMQGFVCSGTLINNTSNDRAPYFLTANHCDSGNESTWAFRFNWISPFTSCGTIENSTDTPINQTTSGATRLAANPTSDFKLLRLDGGLDTSWDLEWAGWDRTGQVPEFVVGIHHPQADIMKVCREDNALDSSIESIPGLVAPVDSWRVNNWDIGVTEGGSSGSAIFDPNGRIVGQLAGGGAACIGTDDNDQPDYYGKFDVSWCSTTASTNNSLATWLDPESTRRTKLNMLSQELNNQTSAEVDDLVCGTSNSVDILLFPNPTNGTELTVSGTTGNVTYTLYDVFGKKTGSGELNSENQSIELFDVSDGMYFIYFETTSGSFTKKIIVTN